MASRQRGPATRWCSPVRSTMLNAARAKRCTSRSLPDKVGTHSKRVDTALPGKHTRRLYDRLSWGKANVLAQLRAGMARLNSYLHRISAAPTDRCSCGQARETVEHFLFRCAKWTAFRTEMLQCTETHRSSEPGRSRKGTPVKRRSRETTFDSGYDSPHEDRFLLSGALTAAKKHRSQRFRSLRSSEEDSPPSQHSKRRSKSSSRLDFRDESSPEEEVTEDRHRGSRRGEKSNSASQSRSTSSRRARDTQSSEDEEGSGRNSEQSRRRSPTPKSAMKQPRRSRRDGSSVHFE
ncbi:uncharacterized protein PV06_11053 [Exophiala oligosperma]|uniref:Reverse transcriptase zinc-binding domain-containing protein n=1 Tax=Exophiala oligosperma TaxID=215243 RepID=A0A0D2D0E6_9EURO|nr:uncharacterized protein PV06_11053 [Exophiala oligosperma]KIW36758.1 hypothetical protein PV06_11053 [Exophiala oligosperma]